MLNLFSDYIFKTLNSSWYIHTEEGNQSTGVLRISSD